MACRQAIIWNNAGILLIRPLGTNFSEILIEIYTFPFKKMHLNMSSGNWRPSCLGFNVLTYWGLDKRLPIYRWFSNAFLKGNLCIMIGMSPKFVPRGQIDSESTWVWVISGSEQATSHYVNQRGPSSLAHICVTRSPLYYHIFNPSMDKWSHALSSVEWNYLSIPKLQRLHRLGMDVCNFIPHFIMDVITYPC